jgi:hypothetical protein
MTYDGPFYDDMNLSHLLHAWELLKHGVWSGSLLGLIIGLERQHVPLMSVLYSLSHREGEVVTLQRDGIIYKVVEVSSFPYELRQHELYFLPLIVWMFAVSLVAMAVVGFISQQRAKSESRTRATTKTARLGESRLSKANDDRTQ